MDYKQFFNSDNKSGVKTKESYLFKNYPSIHKQIIDFIESNNLSNLSFKEKVWYFINGVTEEKRCCGCNGEVVFKGNLNKGYSDFCSLSCANINGDLSKRQKESIMDKYGVISTNNLESVKEKKKESYLKRYGVDNPMKSEEVKNKIKEVSIETYGVDNPMKIDYVKNKHRDTIIELYGVNNVFESDLIKDKIKKTNNKNLGVDYPTQSNVVKLKLKERALDKLKIKYPFIISIDGYDLTCYCNTCETNFFINRVLLNERNNEGYGLCTNCNPIGINSISKGEKELFEFIKTITNDTIENDTSILEGKELDIYIPSKNIAIEYNGLYWHSELFKSNNYHLDKTIMCESKGIKLIHIFEDEWVYKQDIVKSRLKNILGLTDTRIYARKCDVREVSTKDKGLFLDNNHIQGKVKSLFNLGLYYNGELVSLMTFGKGRVIMGGKDDEWELTRFCNKLGTGVIGGASKLLKHFNLKYNPDKIISYADKRWSQGDLYNNLGFKFIHDSVPNYFYINGSVREYRFKYRKDVLVKNGFDPNKSERDIMLERKMYRIYDCGTKRYELITPHIDL